MAECEDIAVTRDGPVARITVNRPERLNSMRNRTADEITAALTDLENDTSVKAIILTGEGRAFGAGYDLSTVDPNETPALDDVLENHFNPMVRTMRQSRLPMVAAVNGPCAGASVGVALACDIVIAARSAYFYEPFVGIALVPDAGNTLFFPRIAGRIRAAPAMLVGDRIPAEEAAAWGLVWRVLDDDALEPEAVRIGHELAGRASSAIAATKRLIHEATDFGMDGQLDLERDLQGAAGRTPQMKDAIAAFFAKSKV